MRTVLAAILSIALLSAPAYAQSLSDTNAQLQALQKQLDALKAQIEQLKAQQLQQQQQAPAKPVTPPAEQFVRLKKGNNVTFLVGKKDEVTVYGHLDLSFDEATKGLQPFYKASGDSPIGNRGWMNDVSTNLTYAGIRGFHTLGAQSKLVYQLETQIDVSATSGITETSSNESDVVKGGLTSRNSYIGIQNDVGSFKIGKTDAPYKNSTGRMNPFSGEWGDYAVIMGNTGGDNRVEFGTRVDHAIWYESPNLNGLHFNLLASPGQNRSYDDSNIAAGEPDCAGGNIPGSGALPPFCNDGSFGALYSGDIDLTRGPFYITGAYELHKKVNRSSDLANLDPNDVADEDAWKIGAQYVFNPRTDRTTTFSAIYEDMQRYLPAYLQYQNERTRTGFWFALTQTLSPKSTLNFGWARANPTPGDPGQHNTPTAANPDNMANMYTVAYKHQIDRHVGWYVDWADTVNHAAAHYDLGAGGRGITTDCHDASNLAAFDATVIPPVSGNGPHCYAGGHLQGLSVGLSVNF